MGVVLYFFIAAALDIFIRIGIALTDSRPFRFLEILVHR